MSQISRRRFIEDSLMTLGAASLAGAAVAEPVRRSGRNVGANEKLRIAVIGFGSRGMNHIEGYAGMKDVEIVTLCDADTSFWDKGVKYVDGKTGKSPKTIQDFRRVLEDKEIDAVSIATPNHTHALIAIWAMQAGKDVYVEKPASHNIFEGRQMIAAARKYGKMCQVGSQSRSSEGLKEAMAFLHSGQLGKISVSRGLCYKPRKSIGKVNSPTPVPSTCDYDLWLGPAQKKDVMRQRFHYDWHWQWEYGNGDLGNQGVHEMDKAAWGLNKRTLPQSVISVGGRFGYVDDGTTPNTMCTFMDYGDSQLIFEVRGLDTPDLKGAKVGNIFYGEKGYMVMPSYSSATAFDNDGNKLRAFSKGGDHFRNFVDACRSRKNTDLNAEIEIGALAAALCHVGNVSYQLGTPEHFNKKTKTFGDNKEAYETFGRFEDHLKANGVSFEETTYKLGRALKISEKKNVFGKDAEANKLATRDYRSGFVIPEKL